MTPWRCKCLARYRISVGPLLIDKGPTMPPIDLILRDDNLNTIGVVRPRDRVFENTDGTDDLPVLDDANFPALLVITKVTWITNDLFGLHGFGSASHTNKFTIRVRDDFVDWFIEHISATVDSGEACKRLW